jgi:hypothetical protein
MGLFTRAVPKESKPTVQAQYAPQVLSTPLLTSLVPAQSLTRDAALEIPSCKSEKLNLRILLHLCL